MLIKISNLGEVLVYLDGTTLSYLLSVILGPCRKRLHRVVINERNSNEFQNEFSRKMEVALIGH